MEGFINSSHMDGDVATMFKKKSSRPKVRILFVDQKNDFSSQMAEYFTRQMYDDLYEVYSAGPEKDIVDCDMISSMYVVGEDIRRQVSKDFKDRDFLREDEDYDFVVYTDARTFEEWKGRVPWQGRQILAQMRQRSDFAATDDQELHEEYIRSMNEVRGWVKEHLADPDGLKAMVVA